MTQHHLDNGTTITTCVDGTLTVTSHHPDRSPTTITAGRIVRIDGGLGLQPPEWTAAALSALTLRALADLLDDAAEADQ